ncbi:hypothetical protein ZWY2020_054525 [Hordeum vulgare]|nr:hypothetical protein ZWY2020_054525 [Hordeum vulgare]
MGLPRSSTRRRAGKMAAWWCVAAPPRPPLQRTVDILGWHWNSLQGQWSFRSLLRAACMESTDPANGLIE